MARGGQILLKVRYSTIAKLFNCSIWTVKSWVYNNKLDPSSLEDIVYKYNNRHLLDKRRKIKTKDNK